MEVRIDKSTKKKNVSLSGKITIEEIAELSEKLAPLLKKGNTIRLDLEHVEKVDVAFFQLLVSLCKTAQRDGFTVEKAETRVPEHIVETGKKTGFLRQDISEGMDRLCVLVSAFGEEKQ